MAESEKTYHSGWIEGAQYWICTKDRTWLRGPFNFAGDAVDAGVAKMYADNRVQKFLILRKTPKKPKLHVCQRLWGKRARFTRTGQIHYASLEEDE